MSIHHISKGRLFKLTNSEQILKPGQIVQGRILKFFPSNKAQIQLGSQTMIAQLEASLAVGEKYYFQVQTTDKVIHLKVLGDRLKIQAHSNVAELLKHLGLKENRTNTNFAIWVEEISVGIKKLFWISPYSFI